MLRYSENTKFGLGARLSVYHSYYDYCCYYCYYCCYYYCYYYCYYNATTIATTATAAAGTTITTATATATTTTTTSSYYHHNLWLLRLVQHCKRPDAESPVVRGCDLQCDRIKGMYRCWTHGFGFRV